MNDVLIVERAGKNGHDKFKFSSFKCIISNLFGNMIHDFNIIDYIGAIILAILNLMILDRQDRNFTSRLTFHVAKSKLLKCFKKLTFTFGVIYSERSNI